MSELEILIIKLYKEGYSINFITNYVFNYKKRNIPKNNQFLNLVIDNNKKYTRLDCYSYIAKTILNYNSMKNKNSI